MTGPPTYANDSFLSAADATGIYYGINTMQPPYQPSGNRPPASDATYTLAEPAKANTLPAQTATTIGDQLSAKGISWAWYAGAWSQAVTDSTQAAASPRTVIYTGTTLFQAHHHPFNYYANYAPGTAARAQHLKDYTDMIAAANAGTLPAVSYYKPQGNLNQHPGYTNIADGDAHIASVISQLQASPQYKNMLIVVTYDENGGWWDHVAPPKGDRWGPGSRIPALIISPFAKSGFVDHSVYDTSSTLRFITHRFGLTPLPGLTARDQAMTSSGLKPIGDLTGALTITH